MKNLFKQISVVVFILISSQSIRAQEVVKPIKKTSSATESVNCAKCPVKKDSKGHVLDRVAHPVKKDSIKKTMSK